MTAFRNLIPKCAEFINACFAFGTVPTGSPTHKSLVVSFFKGAASSLAVVGCEDEALRVLADMTFMADPAWTPDARFGGHAPISCDRLLLN